MLCKGCGVSYETNCTVLTMPLSGGSEMNGTMASLFFSGFSVGSCITEKGRLSVTNLSSEITCWRFDWMLQSSSWLDCSFEMSAELFDNLLLTPFTVITLVCWNRFYLTNVSLWYVTNDLIAPTRTAVNFSTDSVVLHKSQIFSACPHMYRCFSWGVFYCTIR